MPQDAPKEVSGITSTPGLAAPPTAATMPAPGPLSPAAPTPASEFQVGDLVLATADGGQTWSAGRAVARAEDLCLVTLCYGEQRHVAVSGVKALSVVEGTGVMVLDGARGAYLPARAHCLRGDAVAIEDSWGNAGWVPSELVFPDTVEAGSRLVKRKARGELEEAGVVALRAPRGMLLRRNDGVETFWRTDDFGRAVGISPQSVGPNAPSRPAALWANKRALIAAAVQTGLCLSCLTATMFGASNVIGALWGAIAAIVVTVIAGKLLARFYCPLFGRQGLYVCAMSLALAATLLLSLVSQRGILKIVAALFYGWTVIIAYKRGRPGNPPRRKSRPPGPNMPGQVDRGRGYRRGERVFCLPPQEEFRVIATVCSQGDGWVEVSLPDGGTLRLNSAQVYEYRVEAFQRVFARHPRQECHLPGIILHIQDQSFTVRFDDWSTFTCQFGEVWFPIRKDMLELLSRGEAAVEEAMAAVGQAMSQAQSAVSTGDVSSAHTILAQAMRKYPSVADLHLGQAFTYQVEGNHAMAAEEAKLAIGNLSPDHVPYTVLGTAFLKLNRHVEAEEAFRAALNIAPWECGHWHNVGVALEGQGRRSEAEKYYTQARLRGAP